MKNTYYNLNNRVIRRELLVKQEFITLQEYMSSPRFLMGGGALVFSVVFCKSLFVLLSFLLFVIVFVSFFDLQILITPLASSKSSYVKDYKKWRTKKRQELVPHVWKVQSVPCHVRQPLCIEVFLINLKISVIKTICMNGYNILKMLYHLG